MKNLRTHSIFVLLALAFAFVSCSSDDDNGMIVDDPDPMLREATFTYQFNNGQIVEDAPYEGMHADNLMAEMKVEELENEETRITVTLMNTIEGEMYAVHAHDAADPSTTPNGTPYIESPNSDVYNQMIDGNGEDASASQVTMMSYDMIIESYEAFFVVHDPLQEISTTDLTTYLVLGTFARNQPEVNFMSASFDYEFNVGQLDPSFAYEGEHPMDFSATLTIQELANGSSRVSVMLNNALMGETYPVHAHDFADAEETPNGTPYDESPNSDVLTLMIQGGGYTNDSQITMMSFEELTSDYGAFFVIHDPLQELSTTDLTTYLALGVFAN